MNDKLFMAIDQHGRTEHGLRHPRKDLLARYGVQHADKLYEDDQNGRSWHIGYIISGHWFSVYEVRPLRRTA